MDKEQIKQTRTALKLTQVDFGQLVGVHSVTVARWEAGTNKPKGALVLRALARLEKQTLAKTQEHSSD